MIKEIKTEKFEGLAVLVPNGSHNFGIAVDSKGKYLQFFIGEYDEDGDDLGGELKVTDDPRMKLKILGKATQLTEEQCAEIAPYECPNQWCEGGYIDQGYNEKWRCDYCQEEEDKENPNIERFASLMQSLGCYSLNPYGEKPEFVFDNYGKSPAEFNRFELDMFKWQLAQANTGTWLIIGKI
jgi:hypothetical protein